MRTVYIPHVLPPKPEKQDLRPVSMAEMIADAKACNTRLRKVNTANAQGYKRKGYAVKARDVVLPDGVVRGQDLTRDDIAAILTANDFGVTANEIAKATGRTRQSVAHLVNAMIKAGSIRWERNREGDAKKLWVAKV